MEPKTSNITLYTTRGTAILNVVPDHLGF